MERPWGGPVDEAEVDTSKTVGGMADIGQAIAEATRSMKLTKLSQPKMLPQRPNLPPAPSVPSRPQLQRDAMQAVPPPIPAPDPPTGVSGGSSGGGDQDPGAASSLTLQQLRRIVAEVHRAEPLAYDFQYADMGPNAEEIDEWFVYQFWQWVRLNAAQRAFDWHWENENDGEAAASSWDGADNETRTRFVRAAIAGVQSNDAALRSASIGKLVYLVLGRWGDTAMSNATGG